MPSPSPHHQDYFAFKQTCLASTGDAYCGAVGDKHQNRSNTFRQALFSADGTSVITQNEDNRLRTFVLPTDLLEESEQPKLLTPHAVWQSGSNIQSYALYPGFDLQNPGTTLVLSGSAYVPITLRNALHYDTIHGSYSLVSSTTEEHLPPRSLAFTRDGSHFIAGSENAIAAFDCTRTGEGPLKYTQLRPGRKAPRTGLNALTRKGFVSALNVSCEDVLALGTTQREIALYDHGGLGAWASTFSLEGSGNGIIDLKWSPGGIYLLVAERQSDLIQVFDIRNTQQKVCDLTGRNAQTPQPLRIDVVQTASGYEAWAGGIDGQVRMWKAPGHVSNAHEPDAELHMHDAPVTSAVWHPGGAVLATSSGTRDIESCGNESSSDDESSSEGNSMDVPDNTLKVWTV